MRRKYQTKKDRLKNRTIYDDRAIDELRKIHNYIKYKLKEDMIAKRLFKKIKERLNILEYFPFIGKLIRRTGYFEYRKFIIKNYIIIYKINLKEKEINILHIYNQKQKVKKQNYILKYKNNKKACSRFVMSCIK